MLIIPVNQASVGDGNTTMQDIKMPRWKSLHTVYLNANGTIYSGGSAATVEIYVSNEQVTDKADIVSWVLLTTITLDSVTPAQIYDIIGAYNHLKVKIATLVDGKITAHYATREV